MHTVTGSVNHASLAIDPIFCEFKDQISEGRFQAEQLCETQSQLRINLMLCTALFLVLVVTDAAMGHGCNEFCSLFYVRAAIAVLAVSGCAWTSWQGLGVQAARRMASLYTVMGMAMLMLTMLNQPTKVLWHAMAMVIMLVAVFMFIPNRLVYSLVIAAVASVFFVGMALTISTVTTSEQGMLTVLVLSTNAFAFVAARRYQALWRKAFRAHAHLQKLTMHDHLTDCFNRRYLHDHLLQSEIARARRYEQDLTVIMCDIDHFKEVNDTYGHQAGDAAIRHFADVLRKLTRRNIDSIVRYGGEEFLLILPATNHAQGAALAERLRSTLGSQSIPLSDKADLYMTASFGVASVDFSGAASDFTLDYLIRMADEQLYAAKRDGRNCVRSVQISKEEKSLRTDANTSDWQ